MKLYFIIVFCFLSTAIFSQIDSAFVFFKKGDSAYQEKKFQVAEKNYVKGLQYDSTNNNIIKNLANCYLEMKKYNLALNFFKKLYTNNANDTSALIQIADISYMWHTWNDAVKFINLCIDKKIGLKMNYKLAKSYYEQEEYVLCSKALGKASAEDPTNAEIPFLMANIWLQMQRNDKAIEMFKIALQLDTTKYDYYFQLASVYQQLDSLAQALPYYELALAKGMGNDLQMTRTLAVLYTTNKQYEKGIALMEKVIAKKPMDKTLFEDMGYAFFENKKYDDAIDWWDKILQIDKNDARTLYMIGIAYNKKGDSEKGGRLCDMAIEMDPKLAGLRKEMKMPQGAGL